MLKLLLVEDQPDIARNLWDYLERRGFRMDHAADGLTGLRMARSGDYDLIVLDLGLPRLDGLDLCRQLRGTDRHTPVLMLTARDTLDDKLRGFAEGADDYLVKPFALKELEARLRSLHRRAHPAAADGSLSFSDISYDPATMLVRRGRRESVLTGAQARLLTRLLRQAPGVVGHAQLIDAVWPEEGGEIAALHNHVYGLRRLLDGPGEPTAIQSVHGIGYRLVDTRA